MHDPRISIPLGQRTLHVQQEVQTQVVLALKTSSFRPALIRLKSLRGV